MALDPAVVRSMGLGSVESSRLRVASYGGSGFSTTVKITYVQQDGVEKHYFMKSGRERVMFEGEHASLNAIHNVVPSLCPASLAFGALDNSPLSYFLLTDFLDATVSSSGQATKGSGLNLAQKLAQLHTTPAPLPKEQVAKYGFGVYPGGLVTCCGSTPQDNSYKESWASFFAENRLLAVLFQSEKSNGHDAELRRLVERTVSEVVPALLSDSHLSSGERITSVVCHGDLWSGNKTWARIGSSIGEPEEVIFDPRCALIICFPEMHGCLIRRH